MGINIFHWQKSGSNFSSASTANIIGKVAMVLQMICFQLLLWLLKSGCFYPAMNTNMYENPIVQQNIEKLKSFGHRFIQPASGRLACGDLEKESCQNLSI